MEYHFLYIVERISKQRKNTKHYSFYFISFYTMLYSFVLQCPVLRKDEFAYIFLLQNHKLIDHYATCHLQNYLQWMISIFSYNDDTKKYIQYCPQT